MKKLCIASGLVIGWLGSLLGCSAEQKTVSGRPAEIPNRLEKVTNEVGCMTPKSMTIFIWPEFKNEDEAVQAVAAVNKAADKANGFMIANDKVALEETQSKQVFDNHKCMTYAPPGQLRYKVGRWKPRPDPATNPDGAKEYDTCVEVQRVIFSYRDQYQVNNDGVLEAKAEIDKIVGDSKIVPDDVSYSRFDFVQGERGLEVKIGFVDIQESGNNQSTEPDVASAPLDEDSDHLKRTTLGEPAMIRNARYSAESKILRFQLPQVKEGKLTGGVYEFALERSNFAGNARFAGDVKLIKDGVTRPGSASIYGDLLPFDNPKCQE